MNASEKLARVIARFPTPAGDGKLAEVDKQATDAALAELLQGGRDMIVGLVGLLTPDQQGGDSKARHALHALVIHVGGKKDDKQRQMVAEALASTLTSDRPKEVQGFVVRQLQLVGGKEVVGPLGKQLLDADLCDDAAQALLAIREGTVEVFRTVLPQTSGKQRLTIVHALATLRDPGSIEYLKALVGDRDREIRLSALTGLASVGDAGSVLLLLKAADTEGYERIKATQACLLLAENLLAAGKKREAAQVYIHLRDSRTDATEQYVREAAERGLQQVG